MNAVHSPYSPAAASDTIVAAATPPGRGGVAIVRISGPGALAALRKLFSPLGGGKAVSPRYLYFGAFVHPDNGRVLDEGLAVFMPGPASFTGEDVAELHCHGSPVLLDAVVEAAVDAGCRRAARGEFTYRAFANGRLDLSQAEAVAELIAAPGPASADLARRRLEGEIGRRADAVRERLLDVRGHLCVAVDFPDEEIECLPLEQFLGEVEQAAAGVDALLTAYERTRIWQQESQVVLVGRVNAGKSSLLNALAGRQRALVSDTPGTTRDWLDEPLNIDGLAVRLVDTAGLREAPGDVTMDGIEMQGIARGRERVEAADLILLVVDATLGLSSPDHELLNRLGRDHRPVILAWNKVDLADLALPLPANLHAVPVSGKTGQGVDALAREIRHVLLHGRHDHGEIQERTIAPNARQAEALRRTSADLRRLAGDLSGGVPYDLAAVHLDAAVAALADVTGLDAADDVLERVFSEFCIGK